MFKDAGDAGYKINIKRMDEIKKQLAPDASTNTYLTLLIPIYNVMKAMQKGIQYNTYIRPMLLDQLGVLDVLEEMSEEEKQQYAKKPTALNAISLYVKHEVRMAKAFTLKVNNNEIVFEYNKENCKYTILKTSNPLSSLSTEEQIKFIEDNISQMFIEKNDFGIQINIDGEDVENPEIEETVEKLRKSINDLKSHRNEVVNLKNDVLNNEQNDEQEITMSRKLK